MCASLLAAIKVRKGRQARYGNGLCPVSRLTVWLGSVQGKRFVRQTARDLPERVASFPAMEAPANPAAGPSRAAPWAVAGAVAGLAAAAVFFGGASGDGSVLELSLLAVAACGAGLSQRRSASSRCRVSSRRAWRRSRRCSRSSAGSVSASCGRSRATARGLLSTKGWSTFCSSSPGSCSGVTAVGAHASRLRLLAVVLGLALAWALAGKAFPDLFPDGGRIARLRNPVGYWNALALLADAALPLGLWLATAFAARRWRGAGALLFYAAVLTGLLTQSRAGVALPWAASRCGSGWWATAGSRGHSSPLVAGLPAVLVGAWAFTRPALVDDGAVYSQRVDDGAVFGVLAVLGATLAAASVLLPLGRLAQERRRRSRPGARGGRRPGRAARGRGRRRGRGRGVLAARVRQPAQPSRLRLREQSARMVGRGARDLAGPPAGGRRCGHVRDRPDAISEDATAVTQPHSVPLQALAGGGIVGLLLLLTAGIAAAVGVTRSLQRLEGRERAAAAALAVFPLVAALHALVDYDVEFVAVTGPMLIAVGALLAAGRPPRRRPRWLAVAAAGAAALAVIGSVGSPALAARGVERAYELIDAATCRRRPSSRGAQRKLDPLSLQPVWARARAAAALRRRGGGARAVRAAPRRSSRRTRTRGTRSGSSAHRAPRLLRRLPGAQRAYTLDPKSRRWTPAAARRRPRRGQRGCLQAAAVASGPVRGISSICGRAVDNRVLHSPNGLKPWAVDNASEAGHGRRGRARARPGVGAVGLAADDDTTCARRAGRVACHRAARRPDPEVPRQPDAFGRRSRGGTSRECARSPSSARW